MTTDNTQSPDPKDEPYWEQDGKTHINTHFNQSKIGSLGKMLAPYAEYPFTHPYFGPFKTIEGFWHFLRGGCVDDKFRSLKGDRCKRRMKKGMLNGTYIKTKAPADINHIMLLAHYEKISQNRIIKQALIESTLPFDQYFVFGPGQVIIRPGDTEVLIEILEELRKMFKQGIKPEPYDYSHLSKNK